jgi:hypothetical protein
MIDLFRTWLPQIIGYAEETQDGRLERAWADGDRASTSAHYSGELFEQIFGGLDADNMLAEARQTLAAHPPLVNALDDFLCSLKRLEEWIETHVDTHVWGKGETIPASVRSIFRSEEWRDAEAAAAILISTARQAGFRSRDFDPRLPSSH